MDFFEVIRSRYSVRAYKTDPVPEPLLEQVLAAAILAPTASNRQPLRLFVLPTAGREDALRRVYDREWFRKAPLVIGVATVLKEAWVRSDGKCYADVDATIAMDHLILAAAALGLGTCWVGAFEPRAARELLQLPEGWEPLAFTPLGYPADTPGKKRRRDVAELVRRM